MASIIFILSAVLLFVGVAPRDAVAQPELQKAVILTTMAEAAVAGAALVFDVASAEEKSETLEQYISWKVRYSDRDWSFTGAGKSGGTQFQFGFNGYLWGEDGQTLVASYSGSGTFGETAVLINGKADWLYDEERSDYTAIDFRHVMKFGENSVWGWVLGAETIFGGTIGAGAAVAAAAAATGGVAIGAAPWIAAGGAVTGSTALVGASAAAKSLMESNEPAAAPEQPKRPAPPPAAGIELSPTQGTILTAVSHDGEIMASGPDGRQLLTGSSKWEGMVGSAYGEIVDISAK